jgi:hypothetical protein
VGMYPVCTSRRCACERWCCVDGDESEWARWLQLFDLRMMRLIAPISFSSGHSAGPVFTRFMPQYTNTAVLGGASGRFRICDLSGTGSMARSARHLSPSLLFMLWSGVVALCADVGVPLCYFNVSDALHSRVPSSGPRLTRWLCCAGISRHGGRGVRAVTVRGNHRYAGLPLCRR